jgi:hypothetical protein
MEDAKLTALHEDLSAQVLCCRLLSFCSRALPSRYYLVLSCDVLSFLLFSSFLFFSILFYSFVLPHRPLFLSLSLSLSLSCLALSRRRLVVVVSCRVVSCRVVSCRVVSCCWLVLSCCCRICLVLFLSCRFYLLLDSFYLCGCVVIILQQKRRGKTGGLGRVSLGNTALAVGDNELPKNGSRCIFLASPSLRLSCLFSSLFSICAFSLPCLLSSFCPGNFVLKVRDKGLPKMVYPSVCPCLVFILLFVL